MASQVALVLKNPPINIKEARDAGSIPGLGRSPGSSHSNSLQYSCLENPMDRGAWWATVHGVTKSPKHSWGEERRELGTGDLLLTRGEGVGALGDPCHEGPLAAPLEMSV